MTYKLLIINPGSTSTKLAIYDDDKQIVQENIVHDAEELKKYATIFDQLPFRHKVVEEFLKKNNTELSSLSAVMGRGGLVRKGLTAGGYKVNDALFTALGNERYTSPHASALGGLLAKTVADEAGVDAYIYDAVTGVELPPMAKITGIPEIERMGTAHLLNGHAMAEKYAEKAGKKYADLNAVIAHIGGGISVCAYSKGKVVDCLGDDEGSICPERSGTVPLLPFIELCFSGKYTKEDVKKKVRGQGGLYAHLGTSDCRKVEEMIDAGDEKAKLLYDVLALHLAKSIGRMSAVLKGNVDVIILTGGVAYSKSLTDKIKEYISFIAPVEVLPGESEMDALALGAIRILDGKEAAKDYVLPTDL